MFIGTLVKNKEGKVIGSMSFHHASVNSNAPISRVDAERALGGAVEAFTRSIDKDGHHPKPVLDGTGVDAGHLRLP